jgi:hypothetical protein
MKKKISEFMKSAIDYVIASQPAHKPITPLKNQSPEGKEVVCQEEGIIYTEVIRHVYSGNNCVFSAGFVENAPAKEDTIYLKMIKDGETATIILLRPDEAAIVSWIMSGALYSKLVVENR